VARALTKRNTIFGLVAAMIVAMLSASQVWIVVSLKPQIAIVDQVHVSGSQAAPIVFAVSVAALAMTLVIAISSQVLRLVLLSVSALLGAGIVLFTVRAITDVVASSQSELSAVLGLAGKETLLSQIDEISVSAFPWVTMLGGIVFSIVALLALSPSKTWKGSGRRYSRSESEPMAASLGSSESSGEVTSDDRISEWDALTDGDDPSS